MALTFDPIDPKIESNGPRIINHPTKFHAIRFNTFWLMRITHKHARIQINTQRSKHYLPHFQCEGNEGVWEIVTVLPEPLQSPLQWVLLEKQHWRSSEVSSHGSYGHWKPGKKYIISRPGKNMKSQKFWENHVNVLFRCSFKTSF